MIDTKISKDDKKFLKLALNLARRNVGLTGKNPSVGCVITFKDIIIGRGNTQIGGRPHAEIMAIKQALDHPLLQEKNEKVCVGDILKRPEMDFQKLIDLNPKIGLEKIQTGKQCWIEFKYSGYISRQSEEVQRAKRYSTLKIPVDIDYAKIRALSNEAIEKLSSVRPTTLGQASRISGITPATISILRVQLKVQNSKAQIDFSSHSTFPSPLTLNILMY